MDIPVSLLQYKYCTLFTVIVEVEDSGRVYTEEVSVVTLSCEIYGYPRDSSPPVWTSSVWTSDELQSGRFTTTVANAGLLNGSSISTTERVVSQLTIFCATQRDSGEYTCSVEGKSTTVTLNIAGIARYCFKNKSVFLYISMMQLSQQKIITVVSTFKVFFHSQYSV